MTLIKMACAKLKWIIFFVILGACSHPQVPPYDKFLGFWKLEESADYFADKNKCLNIYKIGEKYYGNPALEFKKSESNGGNNLVLEDIWKSNYKYIYSDSDKKITLVKGDKILEVYSKMD